MDIKALGFSEEEFGTLCELLAKLVHNAGGGVFGSLHIENEDTGEKLELHLDVHDAALCQDHLLGNIDSMIGTLQ